MPPEFQMAVLSHCEAVARAILPRLGKIARRTLEQDTAYAVDPHIARVRTVAGFVFEAVINRGDNPATFEGWDSNEFRQECRRVVNHAFEGKGTVFYDMRMRGVSGGAQRSNHGGRFGALRRTPGDAWPTAADQVGLTEDRILQQLDERSFVKKCEGLIGKEQMALVMAVLSSSISVVAQLEAQRNPSYRLADGTLDLERCTACVRKRYNRALNRLRMALLHAA